METSSMRAAWAWAIAAAAVLAAATACAQQRPVRNANPAAVAERPAAKGPYRIAGTILSARDGHPLRGATVRILPSNRGPAVDTTTADESGQFAFTGVPAGTFVLEGSAPGFVSSMYEQHGEFNTGIVTGAAVDTESLVLALEPEGSIRITLTDDAGEPVQGQVELFRKPLDVGAAKPVRQGGGRTDDLGRWDSASLRPGEYYIVVQAAPWYAVHPMHMEGDGPRMGFVDSIQPGVDVAYPITYYPGATDESAATPVEVRGGDPVEISMQLRAEPAFTITVPAPPTAERQEPEVRTNVRPVFTQVTRTVFGQQQPVQAQQTNSSAGMEISGLPPGDYKLRRMGGPGEDGPATTVRITDHSLVSDAPGDSQTAHVTAEVRAIDNTRVSRPTQVLVLRNGEIYRREMVDVNGQASFDIDPGDYALDVQGGARSLKLRQVLADEKPVGGNRVHLAAGAHVDYVLSVAPGNHTVQGVVERGGKPAAGVFVLMIPTADLKDPQTFYRDQSDLDGSFHIAGIAAGEYTLFAVQHGWELDWHNKATYERYLQHATAVKVAETPAGVLKVDPVEAQAR